MGMMMMPIVLIMAAIGYWVLVTAKKEQGGLKLLGWIIGWIIVIISTIAFVFTLLAPAMWSRHMGWGMRGGMMSPGMGMTQQQCEEMMEKHDMMEKKDMPMKKEMR